MNQTFSEQPAISRAISDGRGGRAQALAHAGFAWVAQFS
jgi:hypothetical protein